LATSAAQNVGGGDVAGETKNKKGKNKKRENRLPSLAAAMPAANLIPWIFFLPMVVVVHDDLLLYAPAGRLPFIYSRLPSIHPSSSR
jgi:hypothetical protein